MHNRKLYFLPRRTYYRQIVVVVAKNSTLFRNPKYRTMVLAQCIVYSKTLQSAIEKRKQAFRSWEVNYCELC